MHVKTRADGSHILLCIGPRPVQHMITVRLCYPTHTKLFLTDG